MASVYGIIKAIRIVSLCFVGVVVCVFLWLSQRHNLGVLGNSAGLPYIGGSYDSATLIFIFGLVICIIGAGAMRR